MVKRACLALRLEICFTCACFPILPGGMSQKLYKITVPKGDICKQAKSMLNVPGMFFIASGVFQLRDGPLENLWGGGGGGGAKYRKKKLAQGKI